MPDEPASPARPPRSRWDLVRVVLGGLLVAVLVTVLVRERREIGDALAELSWPAVGGSFLLVVAGLVANMLSWREVLAGLGSRLPVPVAGRVYLLAQLGKYLPGSLWPIFAQVELAREHGVARVRSALAAIVALLLGTVVGVLVAATSLVGSSLESQVQWWWALVAVPPVIGLLYPRVLRWLLGFGLRLARQSAEPVAIDGRALARAAAWSLVMWLALGLHVWVLALELEADASRLLLLCIGAYAAAWIVGLLVVVAPAGAGAREAALVVGLSGALARPDALTVAVVSRVLSLLGDAACVAGAAASARWHRRRNPTGALDVAGVEPRA